SASVSSGASGDGERRSGANASAISCTCPSTKRAASTLPARWLAARSGRAGVMRGSYAVIGSDCRVGKGGGTADSKGRAYRAPCPRVLASSASFQDAWARRTRDFLWGGAVPAPLPTLQPPKFDTYCNAVLGTSNRRHYP